MESAMGFWNFFSRKQPKKRPAQATRKNAHLNVEPLEDRFMPSANVISGFVYHDANHNGIFDSGETPIANTKLELRNDQNIVVGTTTSDANGYYQFINDATVNTTPLIATETFVVPLTQTNFSIPGLIDQFDPSLGQLQSVDIILDGSITSTIKVENTSTISGSTISGIVSGTMNLTGPGVNMGVAMSDNAGTFNASAFDGSINFSGPSGQAFAPKQVSATKTITLTGSDMNPFIGTGQVTFTDSATATSTANGGGNLVVQLDSAGQSTVTVKYHYLPTAALKPGDYTILETQPSGFLDGKEFSGGVVLDHPINTDFINVTLNGADVPNNNFGEYKPASLSGFVYHDINNNGSKDGPEPGINNVAVALSGIDIDGAAVSLNANTNASGFYQFTNLRPGTYTVTETQPAAYLDGKDTIGNITGDTSVNDQFSSIALNPGDQSQNNNFGEVLASSLSGFVYVDTNNNGLKENGEQPIGNVDITLTGNDDLGNAINQTVQTDGTGFYQFTGLRPGSYAINETQPDGYGDGKDKIGSQGGVTGNDVLTINNLLSGTQGINNNFGEQLLSSLSGFVYVDTNNNGTKDGGETPITGVSIILTGTDDQGPVSLTTQTDSNGFYQFSGLRSGNYTISETQPANYLDGKDKIGSQGGVAGNDVLTITNLPLALNGINNNFGELAPAGINGFVYLDANDNGIKEAGELGIPSVTITLTGQDDLGSVSRTAITDPTGFYRFANLRPGTYTVTETQPAGYTDGKDTIGSVPGNTSVNDQFSGIVLGAGVLSNNNNFGEIHVDKSDVGIVKSGDPASVLVGNQFTYTLTVTNYGADVAQGVVVTDTLPNEVTYISSSGPGWTITVSGKVITARMSSLAVNGQAQIFVTVEAPIVPTVVLNTASVTTTTEDDNPSNNTSQATTLIYDQPGEGWPKSLPPLMAQGQPVIFSKAQLFANNSGWQYGGVIGQMIFVDGLSRSLLGHPADYNTQATYSNQLQSGAITRDQLAATFWNSTEHLSSLANSFFQTFYHRNPNATEQQNVVNQLRNGVSETTIAQNFLMSSEYQSTHPTNASLLAGFYADVLGQTPSLSNQLLQLQSVSTMSRQNLVSSLFTNPAIYQQIVDYSYQAILQRHATTAEIQYWTPLLQNNSMSPGKLDVWLMGSSEYMNLILKVANLA
jgi:uncharacterized repeat protein (TIGR01451 family)